MEEILKFWGSCRFRCPRDGDKGDDDVEVIALKLLVWVFAAARPFGNKLETLFANIYLAWWESNDREGDNDIVGFEWYDSKIEYGCDTASRKRSQKSTSEKRSPIFWRSTARLKCRAQIIVCKIFHVWNYGLSRLREWIRNVFRSPQVCEWLRPWDTHSLSTLVQLKQSDSLNLHR